MILPQNKRGDAGMALKPNRLYYGDCLDWMEQWEDNCVDLIYLDPPFNSKTNYNMLFAGLDDSEVQYRAFTDTWSWNDVAGERYGAYEAAVGRPGRGAVVGLYQILGGCGMIAYLTYMAERLAEMHRILKPTGSIYLHCDPTASHYLKIVMDDIFDKANFRNEIVWYYENRLSRKGGQFSRLHDTILVYGKSGKTVHNLIYDENWTPSPTQARRLERGYEVRKGDLIIYDEEKFAKSGIDESDYAKVYRSKAKQPPLGDVWPVPILNPMAKERLGYATQKPLALLERIIKASSNEGDLVLDPFCGCGTAIEAAHLLNRQWAGIDISSFAIDLIRRERPHLKNLNIQAERIPKNMRDAHALARDNRLAFEAWAVDRLPGFAPNTKQTGDKGVDGRGKLAHDPDDFDSRLALAQVKSGAKVSPSDLRDFIGAMDLQEAAIGRFITLEPVASGDMHKDAASLGSVSVLGESYPRLKLWSIRDYFNHQPPMLPDMMNPYKRGAVMDAKQRHMVFNLRES